MKVFDINFLHYLYVSIVEMSGLFIKLCQDYVSNKQVFGLLERAQLGRVCHGAGSFICVGHSSSLAHGLLTSM